MSAILHRERGVALLIVLFVTVLLVVLVFEFAYSTRVSLRATANIRDRERAYFLARSGVNFVGRLLAHNLRNGKLQDNLEQLEWMTIPVPAGVDSELSVMWEDERGKINAQTVREGNISFNRLSSLFQNLGIDQGILSRISDDRKNFYFTSQLHQYLSDEDFRKIADLVTVYSDDRINVNTAPEEVLKALGIEPSLILAARAAGPIESLDRLSGIDAVKPQLDVTSNVFRVVSMAVVGEYRFVVEAIIRRNSGGFDLLYWRGL